MRCSQIRSILLQGGQSSNGHHAVGVDAQSGQAGTRRARPVIRKSASSAQPVATVKLLPFPRVRSGSTWSAGLPVSSGPRNSVSTAGPAQRQRQRSPPICRQPTVLNPKTSEDDIARECSGHGCPRPFRSCKDDAAARKEDAEASRSRLYRIMGQSGLASFDDHLASDHAGDARRTLFWRTAGVRRTA